jgi:hypothetical protein
VCETGGADGWREEGEERPRLRGGERARLSVRVLACDVCHHARMVLPRSCEDAVVCKKPGSQEGFWAGGSGERGRLHVKCRLRLFEAGCRLLEATCDMQVEGQCNLTGGGPCKVWGCTEGSFSINKVY